MRFESTILLRKIPLQHGLCPASWTNHRIWFHFRASAACIIAMIGSRLHKQAGDQKHYFSSFVGSVLEAVEIRSLFAFKKLPDILAILFSVTNKSATADARKLHNAFYQKQCGRHPGTGIDDCQAKRQLELPIPTSVSLLLTIKKQSPELHIWKGSSSG
jgi:hypothetical protein